MKWIIYLMMMAIASNFAQSLDGFGHCAFGRYSFGSCLEETPSKPKPSEGGGGGGGEIAIPSKPPEEEIKRYDFSIELDKSYYTFGENVSAKIFIENKGNIPDEDTVLFFWLSNPINKRFGETREQLIEVPIGKTTLNKEIAIPFDELDGEWRFNARYFTNSQPTIDVYKAFRVEKRYNLFRIVNNNKAYGILLLIGITIIFIAYDEIKISLYKRYKEEKNEEE